MNTSTLDRIVRADRRMKIGFGGVRAMNQLPRNRKHFVSFIINTHPSSKSGEHWQAVFFDVRNRASFFCSYGTPPSNVVKKFIIENSLSFEYNSCRLQHRRATSCGLYCLYFLWHKSRGLPVTQLRSRNPCTNERIIHQFARENFKLLANPGLYGSVQYC